jgi:hypothetical protein
MSLTRQLNVESRDRKIIKPYVWAAENKFIYLTIYRVFQDETDIISENVPYVEFHRYNKK